MTTKQALSDKATHVVAKALNSALPGDYTSNAMAMHQPDLVEALKLTSDAMTPRLRSLAEVEAVQPSYFWEPYLPNGTLTLVSGDAGTGKTWLLAKLAAVATTGDTLPHGRTGKPQRIEAGGVLLLQRESSLGMTLRPRIEQLGGNVARVIAPEDVAGFTFGPGSTPADLGGFLRLAWYIEQMAAEGMPPRFVFIDPIKTFLSAKPNDDKEVRPTLERLAAVAEFYGVPILYVVHYNKNEGASARHRASGSQEFVNVPRCVIHTAHPTDEEAETPSSADTLTTDLLIFHGKPLVYEGHNLAYRITGEQDNAADPLTWAWLDADQSQSADLVAAAATQKLKEATQQRGTKAERISQSLVKQMVAAGMGTTPGAIDAETMRLLVAQDIGEPFGGNTYRRAYQSNAIGVAPVEAEPGRYVWPALVPYVNGERMPATDPDF